MKNITIIGKRFGKLLVKKTETRKISKYTRRYCMCLCDCGNTKWIRVDALLRGAAKTCGCIFTGKITVQCSNCGKDLKRWRSEIFSRRYCNKECKSEWQCKNFKEENHPNYRGGKIAKVCLTCNKDFEVFPKDDKQRFCSSKCYGKYLSTLSGGETSNWKGGYTQAERRIPEYRIWRLSVIKRDFDTCQKCGESNVWLNAHHIKPFHSHEEDRLDIDNGLTLCNDCHCDFHSKYGKINFNRDNLIEYLLSEISMGSKTETVK